MQVRVVTNRNTDLAMCGGRCQVDVTYDVGFDSDGRIHALDIHYVLIVSAATLACMASRRSSATKLEQACSCCVRVLRTCCTLRVSGRLRLQGFCTCVYVCRPIEDGLCLFSCRVAHTLVWVP